MTEKFLTGQEIRESILKNSGLAIRDDERFSEAHFAISAKRLSKDTHAVAAASIYPKGSDMEFEFTFNHADDATGTKVVHDAVKDIHGLITDELGKDDE